MEAGGRWTRLVLYVGHCCGRADCIHYPTGYRHARTLADVGKPVVYVLPPVKSENKNSEGHWILDDCQCDCNRCGRVHHPDQGMAMAVAFSVALLLS